MEYRKLGRSEIHVSVIGLGTMTFGEQNTEAEGHEQIDYAVDQGVNLIDTAEMYSVPRASFVGAALSATAVKSRRGPRRRMWRLPGSTDSIQREWHWHS